HIRADMRIGFWTIRVVEPAHKAELFAEGTERLSRLAKDELAVAFGSRKPTPLADSVLRFRERHAIGGIKRAKAAGNLLSHFGAHGVQNRQSQCNSSHTFEERAAVDMK